MRQECGRRPLVIVAGATQLVVAMRKLLAHGVVGFDNFRQAARVV